MDAIKLGGNIFGPGWFERALSPTTDATKVIENDTSQHSPTAPSHPTIDAMNLSGDCFKRDWFDAPTSKTYDRADYPNVDIVDAINRGDIPLKEGDTLKGWNFSLPEGQKMPIPSGVWLDCSVSSGIVIFDHGYCCAIDPAGVAIANGHMATAVAKTPGAYAFSAAPGATAIAEVAGSFAYGMADGTSIKKLHNEATAVSFNDLQLIEKTHLENAVHNSNAHSAYLFAKLYQAPFYTSAYSYQDFIACLGIASKGGFADASVQLAEFFSGSAQIDENDAVVDHYLVKACTQKHKEVATNEDALDSLIGKIQDKPTIDTIKEREKAKQEALWRVFHTS